MTALTGFDDRWREDQENTVWADGSRLENKAVEAAAAYRRGGSWKTEGTYLGKNKEVFDAEIFAIGRALEVLNERNEEDKRYTVFSDSQAAISRVQHDHTGPGQALAIRAIATAEYLRSRGNTVTLRWTPSHEGIGGNELADRTAKRAAEELEGRTSADYLREASLAHLSRTVTEARSEATAEWIRTRSGRNRRYRPPRGGKMRKDLGRARKELAGRFYQLMSGHAAVADHLRRVGQAESSDCFWCGSGERQTRFHLFVKCRRWTPEIRKMWQRVRIETGGGAPSVRKLFGDERNTKAILEFLEKTKVGKMPSRVLLAGGPDMEEEEMDGLSLRVLEEGEAETGISSSEEEDGPGPPA